MSKLTIAIPTYNRKERLLQQLHSILSQEQSNKVEILVLDNASSYTVEDAIREEFGTQPNIRVIRHKYNVGGDANIAMTFLYCQTQWMWLLGDDDETMPNSIETILNDIERFSEVAYFKYSIKNFQPHEDKVVDTLESLVDYYYDGGYLGGDLIFLSNNVYNLQMAGDYYGTTLFHCYSCVSQLLPVFHILMEQKGKAMFRSTPIITYKRPEKGTAWNMLNVSVGLSVLPLINLKLDTLHYRRLMNKIGSGFPHGTIVKLCLNIENRQQSHILYKHIYNGLFRHTGKLIDRIYYIAFYVFRLLGIKFSI